MGVEILRSGRVGPVRQGFGLLGLGGENIFLEFVTGVWGGREGGFGVEQERAGRNASVDTTVTGRTRLAGVTRRARSTLVTRFMGIFVGCFVLFMGI